VSETDGSSRLMRRAEREITDPALLDKIFEEARILFLGLRDEPAPCVLPVCFGYDKGSVYVHSATAGTKIDLIAAYPIVGFSASTELVVKPGAAACDYSAQVRSVIGTGRARIVTEEAERARGLDAIMRHYATGPAAETPFYKPGPLARTCVIAIRIDTLRGKRIG
jgi:nitroimidazol reductase NimA-like FMN-containing flavoprotein (pyridoxamine 5'-phosphate oxidase superfamily)